MTMRRSRWRLPARTSGARSPSLLTNPSFPGVQLPGVVTVTVVPNVPGLEPVPNRTTLAAVCAYLNEYRVVTTELYVAPPGYQEVQINAGIVVAPDADLGTVQTGVIAALDTYFHALTGGDDGTGWPFGGTIFYSSVYRVIFAVDGVERVLNNDLAILLDGAAAEPCRDVPIAAGGLLYSGTHTINVSYDTSSSS